MTIPENGWPSAWTNIMPRAIRGLARSTLRNNMSTSRYLPAPGHTHDGQGLCWIGLAKQARDVR